MMTGLWDIPYQHEDEVISFLKCLDLPIHCAPSFAHSSHRHCFLCKLKRASDRLCILYVTNQSLRIHLSGLITFSTLQALHAD